MKRNKLTPGYNLFWESSRMMLPEHREQFLEHRRDLNKKIKPILDEQEQALVDQTLSMAYQTSQTVILTVFEPFQNRTYRGRIHSLDFQKKRLKFKDEDGDPYWISFESILDIEV